MIPHLTDVVCSIALHNSGRPESSTREFPHRSPGETSEIHSLDSLCDHAQSSLPQANAHRKSPGQFSVHLKRSILLACHGEGFCTQPNDRSLRQSPFAQNCQSTSKQHKPVHLRKNANVQVTVRKVSVRENSVGAAIKFSVTDQNKPAAGDIVAV